MKLVITGASGFMGREFLERLLREERATDAVLLAGTTSSAEALRQRYPQLRVAGPWPLGGLEVKEAFAGADQLFHFAWSTMPSTAAAEPLRDLQENVMAGMHMLEQARQAGVGRIVFLSSGGTVYGDPRYLPIDEEHVTVPLNPYGISKLSFELYLRAHAERWGYRYLILRPSNVYGNIRVEGRPQGVIEHWMRRMATASPVEVWNDLSLVRDYVYIEDMVEVLYQVLNMPGLSGVMNVGTGVGHSLSDVLAVLGSVTGMTAKVQARDLQVRAVSSNVLDPQKLGRELGFTAKVSLATGVERLWHRMGAGDEA